MGRGGKQLSLILVWSFLAVFLILPIFSLFLVSFTGEPVNVASYIQHLDPGGFVRQMADQGGFRYYLEFLQTRRYRQGLLNSVGVAPMAAAAAWLLGMLLRSWVRRVAPSASSLQLIGGSGPGAGRAGAGPGGGAASGSGPVVHVGAGAAGGAGSSADAGSVARRPGPGQPDPTRWLGMPFMIAAFLAALLWAVVWPWLPDVFFFQLFQMPGPWICPGPGVGTRILQALGFCPLVALSATAVGVAMAFCLTRTTMPGRDWIRLLCIVPLAIPSFLAALSFKILVGDAGILTNLLELVHLSHPFQSQSALSAGTVQVFLEFPLVLLTTAAALDRMDPSLGEAAEVMGARRFFAFWTVHLPVLLPGITAGALLVFIRSLGDFGSLYLLMPTSYPMIVLEAYRDLSGSTYWGGASMLSMLMIAVILTLLALQKHFVERGSFQTVTGRAGAQGRPASSPLARYGALTFCMCVLAVPFALLATTFLISLAAGWGVEIVPSHYTLARYAKVLADFTGPRSPVLNSFKLVLPSLAGCMTLAFLVAYLIARTRHWSRQLLDFAVMLPFVVPGVAFAVALIGAFNAPPLNLHFTVTLVMLAYMVTRMPYGVRSTLASFQQIGTSMEEASKTMGATGSLTLGKVTVPLVLPGLLAGSIMAFISMMQDVAITMMICPPKAAPAGMFVFHAIEEGHIFDASAYGLVLLLLILVPYLLAYRLGGVKTSL